MRLYLAVLVLIFMLLFKGMKASSSSGNENNDSRAPKRREDSGYIVDSQKIQRRKASTQNPTPRMYQPLASSGGGPGFTPERGSSSGGMVRNYETRHMPMIIPENKPRRVWNSNPTAAETRRVIFEQQQTIKERKLDGIVWPVHPHGSSNPHDHFLQGFVPTDLAQNQQVHHRGPIYGRDHSGLGNTIPPDHFSSVRTHSVQPGDAAPRLPSSNRNTDDGSLDKPKAIRRRRAKQYPFEGDVSKADARDFIAEQMAYMKNKKYIKEAENLLFDDSHDHDSHHESNLGDPGSVSGSHQQ